MLNKIFNSPGYPYHILLENAGHRLIRDENGNINIFRKNVGHHNGPECELCHETWCHHCQPDVKPCKRAD